MLKVRLLRHRISSRIMADILVIVNSLIMDPIMVIKVLHRVIRLAATVRTRGSAEIIMATTLVAIGVAAIITKTVALIDT